MRDPAYYREKAAYFRELALEADEATALKLLTLAEDYDALASRADDQLQVPPLT